MDNAAIKQWIAELDEQGIYVYLQAQQLKLRTKLSAVPADILAQIKAHKDALLQYLQQQTRSGKLSYAQQRIWFIEQYESGSTAYNMTGLLVLSKPIAGKHLGQALNRVLSHYQVLRSHFVEQNEEVLQVVDEQTQLTLNCISAPEDVSKQQVLALLEEELQHVFCLSTELLVRATLITADNSDQGRWLSITMHHIVSDGWSVQLFVEALLAELNGQAVDYSEVQYLDYVHWEQKYRQSESYQQQLDYWKAQLNDMVLFELPTSYPRSAFKQYTGRTINAQLPRDLLTQLDNICQQVGVTRFNALLGMFYALLYRYTQQADMTVGVPVLNRERAEFESVIGCFINTLPMRLQVNSEQDLTELLRATQQVMKQGLQNQSVAVEQIIDVLGLNKSTAHSALFQILFNYNGITSHTVQSGGLSAQLYPQDNGSAKFDVTLTIDEVDGELRLELGYSETLYEAALMAQFVEDYIALLASLCADPTQRLCKVPLASQAMTSSLLKAPEPASLEEPCSIISTLVSTAARYPEQTALIGQDGFAVSYKEMLIRSTNLAKRILAELDVEQRTAPVAILVSRDAENIMSMIGVMQAGLAYLPIEVTTPPLRVKEILHEANCHIALVPNKLADDMHAALTDSVRCYLSSEWQLGTELTGALSEPSLSQPAYVIFTSGSTGKPKGAVLSHRALAYYVDSLATRLTFSEHTRSAVVTGLATDLCLTAIYPVLAHGGCVVLASPELEPKAIAHELRFHQVNLIKLTPSFAAELLPHFVTDSQTVPIEQWVLGGEALSELLVEQITSHYPKAAVFNHYGPTEACVGVTTALLGDRIDKNQIQPIGKPLRHVELLLLDKQGELAVPGMPAELLIAGPSLSDGYINVTEQTDSPFVELTPQGGQTQRFYRSGDIARLRFDGNVEYLGRQDNQPKIRGFRVDLMEVEAKLNALPAVQLAAVVCRRFAEVDTLVAHVVVTDVFQEQANLALQNLLKQQLKAYLPEPMVPSRFVIESQLPLLNNGKIDRKSLQAKPLPEQYLISKPETPLQQQLAAIFTQLLGIENVSIHDSFFMLGGHSLLAMRLVNQLKAQFDVAIPLKTIFANPSIAELAQVLDDGQYQPVSTIPRSQLNSEVPHPLSYSQRRLWFIDQMQGHSSQYNLQGVYRLSGEINSRMLAAAMERLIQTQPILAFSYHQDQHGEVTQRPNTAAHFQLQEQDFSELSDAAKQAEVERFIANDYSQSFDLTRELMIRSALLRLAPECHVLIITVHHIVSDGWSIELLANALSAHYHDLLTGEHSAELLTPDYHYIDFVHWQNQLVHSEQWQLSFSHWRKQLENLPKVHELPMDFDRKNQLIRGGQLYCSVFPAELVGKLRTFTAQHGQTLFLTLQTAFSLWFSRASQQRDIAIGTPVAGRPEQAFETVMGNFINTLVLRQQFEAKQSFLQALQAAQQILKQALNHQHIPFDALVDELEGERNIAIHPLIQVVFRVNNQVNEALQLDGVEVELLQTMQRSAKLDLEVAIIDTGDTLQIEWLYDEALWQQSSIDAFCQQYFYVLTQCLQQNQLTLADIALLTPSQRAEFCNAQHPVSLETCEQPLWHQRFEHIAKQWPLHTALTFQGYSLSYRELDQCANQIAQCLLEMALEPQTRVAILLPASLQTVAAVLGVLKAGMAYVPIHYDTPAATLSHIFGDAQVSMTLALSEDAERLIDAESEFILLDDLFESDGNFSGYPKTKEGLPEGSCEQDLCYVIYTSGSTGKPKGVPITHANLNSYLQHALSHYFVAESSCNKSVLSTPLAFDATVTALIPPLMQGFEVELLPEDHSQLSLLTERLLDSRPCLFKLTPAHLRAVLGLAAKNAQSHAAHILVIGGEALDSELLQRFAQTLPNSRFVNEYGPTEATVGCTTFTLDGAKADASLTQHCDVSIGAPITGANLLVLDEFEHLAPPNTPGELLVSGPMVSPGYINQPKLTAQKFVSQSWYNDASNVILKRFYRTGDRVKWQSKAAKAAPSLRYLGRDDEQVKLRGYRIDLEAVRSQLLNLAGVNDCTLTVDTEQQTLIAHVLWSEERLFDETKIRASLAEYLPSYMLPASFHCVANIPLTANGKVDKKALAEAFQRISRSNQTKSLQDVPLTPMQSYLRELFSRVLLNDHITLHDSFFELGGHSLLAIKLISHIREEKHLDITLEQLFKTPTIATLADALNNSEVVKAASEITAVSRDEDLPLSFAQQRLWLIDQVQGQSAQYHMPAEFTLHGKLNEKALSKAVDALFARHEVLRTVIIPSEGQKPPLQKVLAANTGAIQVVDLSLLTTQQQNQKWQQITVRARTQAFDLTHDVVLRVHVAKFADDHHKLHFNMHHIASDGWSMSLLVKEVIAFYRHFSAEPDFQLDQKLQQPLRVQYADYAYWQRHSLQGEFHSQALNYWRAQLADCPVVHQLPLDFARPKQQQLAGQTHIQRLPAELTRAIHKHAKQQGVTLYMWLNSVFALLVMRFSQTNDVLIGSPVAGREQPEVADLIGCFVNTLVIRARHSDGLTFNAWLTKQKHEILDAFKYQALPFEQLVEALQPERNLTHQPLIQILFAVQNNEITDFALPGLHIEAEPADAPTMKFDLEVNAIEQGDGITLEWNSSCALFKPQTISMMADAFATLIDSALRAPEKPVETLALQTSEQQRRLLSAHYLPAHVGCEEGTVIAKLNQQLANEPHHPAVTDSSGTVLSYQALCRQALQLAAYLQEQGLQTQETVALSFTPSNQMLVAMLAVFASGAVYVPVDPKLPTERQRFIVKDVQATWLLTSEPAHEQTWNEVDLPLTVLNIKDTSLWCDRAVASWIPESEPQQLAYVIYTSGTTGTPKGVMISHANLTHYLQHASERYFNADLRGSVVCTPLAFDATVTSIWAALYEGLCVRLLGEGDTMLPQLKQQLCSDEPQLFKLTPAHLQGVQALLGDNQPPAASKAEHQIVVGGEALACEILMAYQQVLPNARFYNEYGPTEATVGCSVQPLTALEAQTYHQQGETNVPIGRAIKGTQLVVLDSHQQPVPAGVIGELYIAGNNLASGYFAQPKLSDEKFVRLPWGINGSQKRYYRSGDLVRWMLDKHGQPTQLQYHGRIDEQVKLRGYRIELDEIRHHLLVQPEVLQASVVLNSKGDNLEAYIVSPELCIGEVLPKSLDADKHAALNARLQQVLPDYMLPQRVILINDIPLTSNGKVDSRTLRKMGEVCAVANIFVAPRNQLEVTISEVFARVLQQPQVGIQDSFFALGGHSLLATQCAAELERKLELKIPVRILFERPTVMAFAQWCAICQAQNHVNDDTGNDASEEMFL
ncbi:amino acid adenylation domain-containing protein [Pseudoalteromonas sp. T1lg65]|uniref:amino acid adenylation domain-containing protein n=1 Tax=Pseudoalteromonas sp. T1lg65 TaxID=2077101 RepID=UPI003F796CB0